MKTVLGLLKHGEWVEVCTIEDNKVAKVLSALSTSILYKKEALQIENSIVVANAFIAFKTQ